MISDQNNLWQIYRKFGKKYMHALGQQNLSPNAIFQRVLARQPILNEFVVIFGYKFFDIQ